jgi:hypothetical protein
MKIINNVRLLCICCLLIGCSTDPVDEDIISSLVQLEIIQPKVQDTFTVNDSITIAATATAEMELHGYMFTITGPDQRVVHQQDFRHIHGRSLMIAYRIPPVIEPGVYRLRIVVFIDHSGLQTHQDRVIVIRST